MVIISTKIIYDKTGFLFASNDGMDTGLVLCDGGFSDI